MSNVRIWSCSTSSFQSLEAKPSIRFAALIFTFFSSTPIFLLVCWRLIHPMICVLVRKEYPKYGVNGRAPNMMQMEELTRSVRRNILRSTLGMGWVFIFYELLIWNIEWNGYSPAESLSISFLRLIAAGKLVLLLVQENLYCQFELDIVSKAKENKKT